MEPQLATLTDEGLVEALVATARAAVAESRLLRRSAVAPLAALLREAALGDAPQSAWAARLCAALPEGEGGDPAQGEAASAEITPRELAALLRAHLPADAHARRLRRLAATAGAEARPLLQGAALLRGAALDVGLLRAVCDVVRRVCTPPLHEWGVVQEPLLLEWRRMLAAEAGGGAIGERGLLGDRVDDEASDAARRLFLEAALLARHGDQRGAKHGCVLVDDASGEVLGRGFNHRVHETASEMNSHVPIKHGKQRILHAECDAVADTIERMGEDAAFAAFTTATAWIVELSGSAVYDDAPPCPKCTCLLRAVGLTKVRHSTSRGELASIALPPMRAELLACDLAYQPLLYACQSRRLRCRRLEEALSGQCGRAVALKQKRRKTETESADS
ncbi:hypothetical protein AB1Y20_002307 [Prymnesium parvum]|uniref:CMP/dCMP-type deaminase domain-containing protein n=1 Tax=Prymnesium parvum TaxID=97485 RepID=A0AB34JAA0_PRYPA